MKADERLEPAVIETIREAIADAGGNEVFFIGELNRDGRICGIRTAARGNRFSVPALKPYLEKSDSVIHNHPSGDLTPSSGDLAIAAEVGNNGIGFLICDNSVDNIYIVAEAIPVKERVEIEGEFLAGLLEPGGRLSRIFPEYEERRSQVDMLRMICDSFNTDTICAAEAGTGVGKSLAYLVPAMDWVNKNDERVVISTATINLQHQLLEKDIPLVREILETDTRAVIVKGRRNYICLHRLRENLEELSLFKEESKELAAVREWAESTLTGSLSDLSFVPGPEVWSQVCSEAESCLGLRCRHREGCFVLRARREAASAEILVVNHHLLFSDLAIRLSGIGFDSSAVLPPFRRIIFDEAHNIESSATSFFSESYSRFGLRKFIGRLYRRKRGRRFGLIFSVARLLPEADRKRADRLPSMADEVVDRADILDAHCSSFLGDRSSLLIKIIDGENPVSELLPSLSELENSLLGFCYQIKDFLGLIPDEDAESDAVFECRIVLRRLEQLAGIIDRFKRFDEYPEDIFWLEKSLGYRGDSACRFVITPLNIAPFMQEAVFDPYPSLVFTSATLTVNGSFIYWKSRIGLNSGLNSDAAEMSFPSPFNYRENVLLGVPTDAPMPTEPSYLDFLSDFIAQILAISEGRALVLFTAYSMLNDVYSQVQKELSERGISIFKQGDDDRNRLLVRFREDTGSVLFATDSFWEGIDTPGEALEVLLVCRLPFQVPSDPVFQARTEAIEKQGGNAFLELSLPDAAIKLKQGFGRLMRRNTDMGIVIILDSRIIKKSYGRYLLGSLPESIRKITEARFLLEAAEVFLVDKRTQKADMRAGKQKADSKQ